MSTRRPARFDPSYPEGNAATVSIPAEPTVAVLYADAPPPGMATVEASARVRYARADELAGALDGADILLVWDFTSSALAGAWPAADRLRWMHVAGAGVDRVLFPGLVESDVVLTNSRGIFDRPIAEYVLCLILGFAKDAATTFDLQRQHTWRHRETELVAAREVLVVGSGAIGREIARLLAAIGMAVRGVGRTPRPEDPDFGEVLAIGRLDEALPAADYVVVAAPLTEQTRGLIDAGRLARMKSTARLINIGRGPIVVEDDLAAALRSGQLAGAGLDVFAEEPLAPDSALWDLPGMVVSPHMSGDFIGWLDALAALFTDNFQRWLAGQPLRNVVDKRLGYVPSS